jgi:hypothetical protein
MGMGRRDHETFDRQTAMDRKGGMGSLHSLRHGFTLVTALVAAVVLPPSLRAQDCTPRDLSAALQPNDKAFAPALELSQDLQRGGFVVRCILRSRWEGLFEGLTGAALYRTDRGDFEALFLPAPNTFERLIVNERKEGDRWVYSFEGQPKPWLANRMEGRRIQFVKDAQRLLLVLENETLAASLRRVLDPAKEQEL